jgi:hypothetical protein
MRGVRPPLLQPDPDLQAPDVVREYHRAPAAGDVDAVAGGVRTGCRRPRAVRRDSPWHGRTACLLRAAPRRRRWAAPRALRHGRRRPRLRAGVQRRCSGPEGVAARSRHRRACPRRRRQARRRPHLRRRPPVAEPAPPATRSSESRDETCMSR